MFGQLNGLLGIILAVSAWSTKATNVTAAKSLAITAVGQPRSSVVRSERLPAVVERHIVSGLERQPAALGEIGSSFISEAGADVFGAHVVEALHPPAPGKGSHSVVQSKGKGKAQQDPAEPSMGVNGKIYLRQPAEHKGSYKTREWFCDACHMLAGKGKKGGDHTGCFTVNDFVCAGGEKCLMDGSSCYFGRVELPQGIQVTYYSGFSGEPDSGNWDDACVGHTDRGTTSDPTFPELKGMVPSSPAVCAMKFEIMSGFVCETPSGTEDWKDCGTDGYPPPDSHATACSSVVLAATVVMLGLLSN